jgi:hypothetical protein
LLIISSVVVSRETSCRCARCHAIELFYIKENREPNFDGQIAFAPGFTVLKSSPALGGRAAAELR